MSESFYSTVITEKGLALMTKQQLGTPPIITRAEAGEGFVPESELEKQIKVLKPVGEMAIGQKEIVDNRVIRVPLQITNQGLENTAMIRQVGVYAQDPDEGEILYQITQYSVPQPLPSQTASRGTIATFECEADLFFANVDNAVIETSPGFLLRPSDLENYYNREQVDTYLSNKAPIRTFEELHLTEESATIHSIVDAMNNGQEALLTLTKFANPKLLGIIPVVQENVSAVLNDPKYNLAAYLKIFKVNNNRVYIWFNPQSSSGGYYASWKAIDEPMPVFVENIVAGRENLDLVVDIYVDKDGNDDNSGRNKQFPIKNIRKALLLAQSYSRAKEVNIKLGSGTFEINEFTEITSISARLQLDGVKEKTTVVLNSRLYFGNMTDMVLYGVIFKAEENNPNALAFFSSSLRCDGCSFSSNPLGAWALTVNKSKAAITSCTFSNAKVGFEALSSSVVTLGGVTIDATVQTGIISSSSIIFKSPAPSPNINNANTAEKELGGGMIV